jgi:hypothetical protein
VDELLLLALASIGLCHVLVDSSLMAPVKDYLGRRGWEWFVRMLNCYQCAGFWSGVAAGLILLLERWLPYLHLLLYGFAASFLGPLAAVFFGYLNAQSSAATGTDRREPEAYLADSPGGNGGSQMPAEADGMAGACCTTGRNRRARYIRDRP